MLARLIEGGSVASMHDCAMDIARGAPMDVAHGLRVACCARVSQWGVATAISAIGID